MLGYPDTMLLLKAMAFAVMLVLISTLGLYAGIILYWWWRYK
jgi:hypothetical protein